MHDHDVYLHGRGLACALGLTVANSATALAARRAPNLSISGLAWPRATLPDTPRRADAADWQAHAQARIRAAVAECGADTDRRAPLLVASSSLNVGGLEAGLPFPPDQQAFVEEIAHWLDWQGPVYSVATACTSAINAVLMATTLIKAGLHDEAVVLGLELPNDFTPAGFGAMQLLATGPARPLDARRDGLLLGEAIAAIRLGRRPARWRVAGGANRIHSPNPVGADRDCVASVVADALDACGLAPADIGLVKLQAAGSPQNDVEEIAGLARVFDPVPPLTTCKSVIGHTLGASGAAELALLTAGLEAGVLPAVPIETPDPALAAVGCATRPASPRYVLANIIGFGGGHACLVVEDTTCR